jgi:hypothetical protein
VIGPLCATGHHGQCPGYYRVAHTCQCGCHRSGPRPVEVCVDEQGVCQRLPWCREVCALAEEART